MIKDAISFLEKGKLLAKAPDPSANPIVYITTPKGEEALKEFYNLVEKFFRNL